MARAIEPRHNSTLFFLSELIRSPQAVSALTPSSKPLAKLVTSELQGCPGPVIELGPGTGVITQSLLERGIPESRLGLVETSERFCTHLRETYPQANILTARAEQVARLDFGFDSPPLAVVSGVPLLSLPLRTRYQILASAFQVLGETGAFYQFTYSFRSPVPGNILERLGLESQRIGTVLANVPPASVFRFRRITS